MPLVGVGGAVAIRRKRLAAQQQYDPEYEEYLAQKKLLQASVKCGVKLFTEEIPPHFPPEGVKVDGVLVLEAKSEVNHAGIFLLLKGLPQQQDKRKKDKKEAMRQNRNNPMWTVVQGVGAVGEAPFRVEGGVRETYPVEILIPEELPPPLITGEGRLLFKVQAFLTTAEGRHVCVGETPLRWIPPRIIAQEEERDKELRLELRVESKRAWLVGHKKTGDMEWRLRRSGYLRGERIMVELWGKTGEKEGLEVDCSVELVQKVWYQVPQGNRMELEMKINTVARVEGEGLVDWEEEDRGRVWGGMLRVPRNITPTYKLDFTNSVSYVMRFGMGLRGENKEGEGWVKGEVGVVVGTQLEQPEEVEGEGGEEEEEEASVPATPQRSPTLLTAPEFPAHHVRRGSCGEMEMRQLRSGSVGYFPPWAMCAPGGRGPGSVQSFASSTLSVFQLPPSYQEVDRPTLPRLDALPPAYCELEMSFRNPVLMSPEEEEAVSARSSPGLPLVEVTCPSKDGDEGEGKEGN